MGFCNRKKDDHGTFPTLSFGDSRGVESPIMRPFFPFEATLPNGQPFPGRGPGSLNQTYLTVSRVRACRGALALSESEQESSCVLAAEHSNRIKQALLGASAGPLDVAPSDYMLGAVPIGAWGGSLAVGTVFSRVPIVRLGCIPDPATIDSIEGAWLLAVAHRAQFACRRFAYEFRFLAPAPTPLLLHGLDNASETPYCHASYLNYPHIE
jgi:hypothetical protein